MKVYGWTDFYAEGGNSRQGRYIMAAPSVAAVLRSTGMTRHEFSQSGCETGNEAELATASAEPGTIFVQPLNVSIGEPWKIAERYGQ